LNEYSIALIYTKFNLVILQRNEEKREREAIEMKLRRVGTMKIDGYSCSEMCTMDGSVDSKGRPANKKKTGGWLAGSLLLGNSLPYFFSII